MIIVVMILPEASGWRLMPSTALPTACPRPMPEPRAASPTAMGAERARAAPTLRTDAKEPLSIFFSLMLMIVMSMRS